MSAYNLETVKSPRLCGRLLDVFSRLLRLPIVGRLICEFIKRKNRVDDMVRFAARCHPPPGAAQEDGEPQPLIPLYFPVHEMTADEAARHLLRATEAPLDLTALAAAEPGAEEDPRHAFRPWTIADYTGRYARGTTTPTRVVERILAALERLNAAHGSASLVTAMNVALLRSQAAESTRRYRDGAPLGVLDGVPILVKDQIPTAGFPLTHGTSFLADPVTTDIFPIMKLKRQGVLIVGKTNQHEVGIGTTGFNQLHGTPRNPYGRHGRHYYTGGSSSGSAAAVACGLVPLALAADGGGSTRIPAGLCGVVGLKPTFKRLAMDSRMASSVYHPGPIAATVRDAALAYAVMAGGADEAHRRGDHRDQSRKQPPVHLHAYVTGAKGARPLAGLRVGVFEEHVADADANVVAAARRAVEYYRARGAEIVPVVLPHLSEIHVAHGATITTEMFSMMERHYRSADFAKLSPETRVSLAIGASWSSSEFLAAQKVRSWAMAHIEDLFLHKIDVLLSPATPCVAPEFREDARPRGESHLAQTSLLMRYMVHGNLTGIPGIVFPVAYDAATGLPISLQIQAAHWREDVLFMVAGHSQGLLEQGVAKPAMYVDILGQDA